MSSELIVTRKNEGIWDTLQQMHGKGIRRIPVVNKEGDLEGFLAVDDLAELFAEEFSLLARLAAQGQTLDGL